MTALTRAAALAAALSALAPAAAAGRTETLRFFMKETSTSVTTKDGDVVTRPPLPEPGPGDRFDIFEEGHRGDHRRHARRATISNHVRCVFVTAEPECLSHVAIGGALLVWEGYPGTLVAATGRYADATGRIVVNQERKDGTDIVARLEWPERRAMSSWQRALWLRSVALNRRLRSAMP